MLYSCDCCGKTTPAQYLQTDQQHRICNTCYQKSYTRCEHCQSMIHVEDTYHEGDRTYCFSCYSGLFQLIHPHDFKPEPIFYGAVPRFFGVELELEDGGHSDEKARILLGTVNSDAEYIYIKSDSSLRNGLEIVSHPMTLDYHLHHFAWNRLLETAQKLGYHADDKDNCGLHIHVNRSGFGNTSAKQEQAINELLRIVQRNREQLTRLSRRKPESLAKWALFENMQTPHSAVSLNHTETVEFRFFQSTLHPELLFESIRLTNDLCSLAAEHDKQTV